MLIYHIQVYPIHSPTSPSDLEEDTTFFASLFGIVFCTYSYLYEIVCMRLYLLG